MEYYDEADLARKLNSPNEKIRRNAAKTLYRLADEGENISEFIPRLRDLLNDNSDKVKYYACKAISSSYIVQSHYDQVIHFFHDEDSIIRKVAAELCKEWGFKHLEDEEDKKSRIVPILECLLILGEKEDIDEAFDRITVHRFRTSHHLSILTRFISSDIPEVRHNALSVLEKYLKEELNIFSDLSFSAQKILGIVDMMKTDSYIDALSMIKDITLETINEYKRWKNRPIGERRIALRERNKKLHLFNEMVISIQKRMNPLDNKEPMKWKKPRISPKQRLKSRSILSS